MFEFSMIPTKNKPTIVTNRTHTAIIVDNIMSTFNYEIKSAIIKTDYHFPVMYVNELKQGPISRKQMEKFMYKHDSTENTFKLLIKQGLLETSWGDVKNLIQPNRVYNKFLVFLLNFLTNVFRQKK